MNGSATELETMKAKVFRSGNRQAVRLPVDFPVTSQEVEVFRRGDDIVLGEAACDPGRTTHSICELPDGNRTDRPALKHPDP
jgi:antitoxin VapB